MELFFRGGGHCCFATRLASRASLRCSCLSGILATVHSCSDENHTAVSQSIWGSLWEQRRSQQQEGHDSVPQSPVALFLQEAAPSFVKLQGSSGLAVTDLTDYGLVGLLAQCSYRSVRRDPQ